MAAYAIKVMVIDKTSRKGVSGQKAKLYGGSVVKTNSSGIATLIATSSSVTVYVNGTTAYNGSASNAPDPIIYEKG